MYVRSSHIAENGSTGQGCQSCSWSTEQGKIIFPFPRTCLRIWSRETGSAVPSRVSLLILHTQSESGAYSRDFSRFPRQRPFIYSNRHTSLGQCRLYRVVHLRTNDVHCSERYRDVLSSQNLDENNSSTQTRTDYCAVGGPVCKQLSYSTCVCVCVLHKVCWVHQRIFCILYVPGM